MTLPLSLICMVNEELWYTYSHTLFVHFVNVNRYFEECSCSSLFIQLLHMHSLWIILNRSFNIHLIISGVTEKVKGLNKFTTSFQSMLGKLSFTFM